MTLWLFRAGRSGEYENKYLADGRVYLTWEDLNVDLRTFDIKQELYRYLEEDYGVTNMRQAINWASQIWPIAHDMKIGDWVVLPSKLKSSIHFGEITGDYEYDPKLGSPYFHYRPVKWFATDIPRSYFDQDLLYSFGAFMTVCRISRNDAEKRIKRMAENGWKPMGREVTQDIDLDDDGALDAAIDLEQAAIDAIAKHLIQKYKGHGMVRIVEAILKAKGYLTFRSPEGPDKGVDILAAQGNLGFGQPKICVQVKTTDSPVERPILDQLIGTMANFGADYGLLVSWAGFKSTVDREIPSKFFKVRLWDQKMIISELLANYNNLDEDIKAEIPLKRIWVLTLPSED